MDHTIHCDHSLESYWAVPSCGGVCFVIQCGSNFLVCGSHHTLWPFFGKLLSSAFMWCCFFCTLCVSTFTVSIKPCNVINFVKVVNQCFHAVLCVNECSAKCLFGLCLLLISSCLMKSNPQNFPDSKTRKCIYTNECKRNSFTHHSRYGSDILSFTSLFTVKVDPSRVVKLVDSFPRNVWLVILTQLRIWYFKTTSSWSDWDSKLRRYEKHDR